MKGRLYKKIQPDGWYVAYSLDSFTNSELRLHPDDIDSDVVRWANNGSLDDKEVEFVVEKKFMANERIWYARLTPYVSDNFQIGPDGAYEHDEENELDWDVTLMDGLEDDDTIPPTEDLIESHKRYVEMMKYIHEEEWERIYSRYKGVSDLNDFFDWLKTNYYPPAKKQIK